MFRQLYATNDLNLFTISWVLMEWLVWRCTFLYKVKLWLASTPFTTKSARTITGNGWRMDQLKHREITWPTKHESLIAREESMNWLGCKCCCSIMRITKILAILMEIRISFRFPSVYWQGPTRWDSMFMFVFINSKIQFRNVDGRTVHGFHQIKPVNTANTDIDWPCKMHMQSNTARAHVGQWWQWNDGIHKLTQLSGSHFKLGSIQTQSLL